MQQVKQDVWERKGPAIVPGQASSSTPRSGKPVRICFLIDELAQAGTESQLLALVRHLDRERFQPYLCLLRGDNPVSRALEPSDCPVLRLQVGSLQHPRTLLRGLQFLRFLRREKIDILQAYFPDSSYFGVPLAWLAGVPHRARTRNNIGHWCTPLHRRLGKVLNAFTTTTIANCHAARESLLRDEGPRPETVVVLENGVDLSRFEEIPEPRLGWQQPARIGIVANLRPVKGLQTLIEAAALLQQQDFDFLVEVAGEGEMRPALQELIDRSGLTERFLLRGAVADISAFLARLDVAVLCSHAEGMSNAILEYMAAARPIAATAVGATPELIRPGKEGILFPPKDSAALARAIGSLLRDPELGWRLGCAARRRASSHLSRQAMVRRFEAFYEGLVGRAAVSPDGRKAKG